MIEQEKWIFFREIDWNCPNFTKFNIDTRDFHVGYNDKTHPDVEKLKKYKHDDFFVLENELIDLIERYYEESGGDIKWRFFMLEHESINNWSLKYIRIFRTEYGFLVCDSNDRAIRRGILMCKAKNNKY
jgi:hypothetical protein